MKAIYSSKLFRASTRKDKIRAALADPLNAELVKQLKSYIDDDELEKLSQIENDDAQVQSEVSEDDRESSGKGASMEPSGSSGGGGGYHPSGGFDEGSSDGDDTSLSDILRDDDLGTVDEPSDDTPSEDNDEVSESVDISGVDNAEPYEDSFTTSNIQKELNSVSTTSGVRRVSNKGSEIWIYYNDDINLNKVMESVISKLEKLEDKDVEFNRLARTENAIVFQVNGDNDDK